MSEYDPNYIPVKNYFLIGTKCLVFNSEGKILILKRSQKSGGGGWSLPGGGLEKDESPEEGIKREVTEETQLKIKDVSPIHIITLKEKGDSILMIAYKANTSSDKVILNWEHDEYRWIDPQEALKEDLSETLKDFIRHSIK